MQNRIIGREKELGVLKGLYASEYSEFVAICGRRRVGKTFLVRECFEGKITFSVSGLAHSSTVQQLGNFRNALRRYGAEVPASFKSWQEAFESLIMFLMRNRKKRKIVFLDELPWMDTPKSNFIAALEGFWNGWAAGRHDVLLVVCGSATSWMMNKLIMNHGGLHNRLTRQIYLQPFTLTETKAFLLSRGFILSVYELAVCYMVFGGIPYYLNLLDASSSLAQNIDELLFRPNGELHYEFNNLYAALFQNSQDYIKVVVALGERHDGLTRSELQRETGLSTGGSFSRILENLEHCGFIRQYATFTAKRKERVYQLVDFFTLFYLRFLKNFYQKSSSYWQGIQRTAKFYAWAGLTFELLVLQHVEQVKRKLGIQGVLSEEYAYRAKGEEGTNAQIDLLIDRNDNTVSVCEMKFTEGSYTISHEEELKLRNRLLAVRSVCPAHKSIQLVLVTTFGVTGNASLGLINQNVTLQDLI